MFWSDPPFQIPLWGTGERRAFFYTTPLPASGGRRDGEEAARGALTARQPQRFGSSLHGRAGWYWWLRCCRLELLDRESFFSNRETWARWVFPTVSSPLPTTADTLVRAVSRQLPDGVRTKRGHRRSAALSRSKLSWEHVSHSWRNAWDMWPTCMVSVANCAHLIRAWQKASYLRHVCWNKTSLSCPGPEVGERRCRDDEANKYCDDNIQ